jgi:hypothetical protein
MTAAWAAARVARLHGSHESWQGLVGRALQDLWRIARAQKAVRRDAFDDLAADDRSLT